MSEPAREITPHVSPSQTITALELRLISRDEVVAQYSHFNDFKRGGPTGAYLRTMFDEVRKAGPGLYLGIGRVGFTEKTRSDLHPFILEGPVAPFVGGSA
jgi:hypothetical protein